MNDKVKLKGHIRWLTRWPFYLSVLLVIVNVMIYPISVKAGLLVSAGLLLYIGMSVGFCVWNKPRIMNELLAFANQYDTLEKRIIEELAIPYAIMDTSGKMIWSNRIFASLTGKDQFYKKNISTVFPDITADKLPTSGEKSSTEVSARFNDRIYRISMQKVALGELVSSSDMLKIENSNMSLIAMYLYDDTELKEYIQKNEDNKIVVALAYLDNYEEALETVEDVRRSLLIALIDRKITKYFSNFDGLVKKLEKDKYCGRVLWRR